jgi:hypothetical protein
MRHVDANLSLSLSLSLSVEYSLSPPRYPEQMAEVK